MSQRIRIPTKVRAVDLSVDEISAIVNASLRVLEDLDHHGQNPVQLDLETVSDLQHSMQVVFDMAEADRKVRASAPEYPKTPEERRVYESTLRTKAAIEAAQARKAADEQRLKDLLSRERTPAEIYRTAMEATIAHAKEKK